MGIVTTVAVSALGVSALKVVRKLDAEFNTDDKAKNIDRVHTVDGVDGVNPVRGKIVDRTQAANPYISINLLAENFAPDAVSAPQAVEQYETSQQNKYREGLEYRPGQE